MDKAFLLLLKVSLSIMDLRPYCLSSILLAEAGGSALGFTSDNRGAGTGLQSPVEVISSHGDARALMDSSRSAIDGKSEQSDSEQENEHSE